MEDVTSFVFDFFMERHIALKEEWLSNAYLFLKSSLESRAKHVLRDPLRIANLVYEQWKYADIEVSTYPLLKQLSMSKETKKAFLTQPAVLQINSIVDIGASYHAQFTALVHEFIDNTGFEPLPEMEQGGGPKHLDAKPGRMLMFTLSDGETKLGAVEYYSIKSLSLLTEPGSKILLIPPILCRNGVLLLKPENVQFLGGDVESLFVTGRPLQVMAEKLNIPLPNSKKQMAKHPEEPCESVRSKKLVADAQQDSRGSKPVKEVVIPCDADAPILNDEDYNFDPADYEQENTFHGVQDVDMEVNDAGCKSVPNSISPVSPKESFRSTSVLPSSSFLSKRSPRTKIKPVAQISPMETLEGSFQKRRLLLELEETPPDFDTELAHLESSAASRLLSDSSSEEAPKGANALKDHMITSSSPGTSGTPSSFRKRPSDARTQSSLISLCDSQAETSGLKQIPYTPFDPSRRPVKLGIQGFLQSFSPVAEKQSNRLDAALPGMHKKVKIEVIDIEDDDDDDDVKPMIASFSNSSPYCDHNQTQTEKVPSSHTQSDTAEDDLVLRFRKLNVVRIADALKQMRFAVGSSRKTVQPIILDIVDALRIVDGMWTMKVNLQDESIDNFTCLIDNPTLSSLIGLTPAEAMEVRASSDIERRKDGQRRLGAVEEQLKRLDLLLDVEMFSGGRADPVIRNIRTFMQALDVL